MDDSFDKSFAFFLKMFAYIGEHPQSKRKTPYTIDEIITTF